MHSTTTAYMHVYHASLWTPSILVLPTIFTIINYAILGYSVCVLLQLYIYSFTYYILVQLICSVQADNSQLAARTEQMSSQPSAVPPSPTHSRLQTPSSLSLPSPADSSGNGHIYK